MEIVYKKVNDLIPYINNSRTHSEEQINQIVGSINEFGFTNPLLIDEKDNIIAGHGRLLASKKVKNGRSALYSFIRTYRSTKESLYHSR